MTAFEFNNLRVCDCIKHTSFEEKYIITEIHVLSHGIQYYVKSITNIPCAFHKATYPQNWHKCELTPLEKVKLL